MKAAIDLRRPKLAPWALFGLMLLGAQHGHADTANGIPENNRSRRVQIELVAQVGENGDLDALLVEWFGAESAQLAIHHVPFLVKRDVLAPAKDPGLLRIWVALTAPTVARLYFAESSGKRFLIRDVPLRNGLDEFGRENLAQVIVTSAQAFIEQGISSPVAEVVDALKSPPSSTVGTATNREPQSALQSGGNPWRLRAGVSYALAAERSDIVDHGPGILVGLWRQTQSLRFSLNLKAGYQLPKTIAEPDIELTTRRYGFQSTLAIEANPIGHVSFGLEGGVGLEHESFEPHSTVPGAWITSGGEHWRPSIILGPRLVLSRHNFRWVFLGGVSIYYQKTHFDVVRAGVRQVEYQPWAVQPFLALEASWR